jgi:hypothetical protein
VLQLVGGAFIVAGVIVVKLGERPPRADAAACDACARRGRRSRPARRTRARAVTRAKPRVPTLVGVALLLLQADAIAHRIGGGDRNPRVKQHSLDPGRGCCRQAEAQWPTRR